MKPMAFMRRGAVILSISLVAAAMMGGRAQADYQWPDRYIIGTSGLGSTGYAMQIAFSNVLQESTGMNVRVLPEDNQSARAKMLKKGKIHSIGGEGSVAADIVMAEKAYATEEGGPFRIRDIYPTSGLPLATGFFVRGDSEIKSIWDIEPGVKISNLTAIPGMMRSYKALLAWVGLEAEDATFVPFGSYAASMRAVAQGKADIAYGLPVSPVILELESSPHGIRWIDMNPNRSEKDKEGAKRFHKYMPTFLFRQNQMGVESAKGFWGIYSLTGTFVNANLDNDFIYHLVKWTAENFSAYKDKHRMLQSRKPEMLKAALPNLFIPLHQGAVRYLKEKGWWSPADQRRQQYNAWLVDRYSDAYEAAKKKASAQGIDIHPDNEKWKSLWNAEKDSIPIFQIMSDAEISRAIEKYQVK